MFQVSILERAVSCVWILVYYVKHMLKEMIDSLHPVQHGGASTSHSSLANTDSEYIEHVFTVLHVLFPTSGPAFTVGSHLLVLNTHAHTHLTFSP